MTRAQRITLARYYRRRHPLRTNGTAPDSEFDRRMRLLYTALR